MVKVTIAVEANTEEGNRDPYPRYVGLSIDEPLEKGFYNTQPEKIIGIAFGKFKWEKEVELSPGRHTVQTGVSSWADYKWDTILKANGKVVAQGKTSASGHNYLSAAVIIGPGGRVAQTPKIGSGIPPIATNVINMVRIRGSGILSNIRAKLGSMMGQ